MTSIRVAPARSTVQLFMLAGAVWGVLYARSAFGPLQEALQADLSLSDNTVALLQGPALGLPMALGAIPLGLLIDRYSRARLFFIAIALTLGASVISALASSLTSLMFARCIVGLAQATLLIGAYSVVADLYPTHQRGRATMVLALGEIGGSPAAFALGGVLLAAFASTAAAAETPALAPWRQALLWMSVALLPVLLMTLALREPPRTGVEVRNLSLREVWPDFWRHRNFIFPLLFARIMIWIADGAVYVWTAPVYARRFDLSAGRIGALMGVVLLTSGILGPILGGPLADWAQRAGGPRRTALILSMLALASVPAALFARMPDPVSMSLMLAAFLTLGFAFGTCALTLATVVVPGEVRGLFLALSVTLAALFSTGLAPVAVSVLSGALGGPASIGTALAIVCALTSLTAAAIFAWARPAFPARMQTA